MTSILRSTSCVGRISRRKFIKTGIGAGTAFAGGISFGSARAADLEGEVVFACDGGIAQNMFQKEYIPAFTQRTGVRVTYIPGQPSDNLAKLRAQKNTPAMDVVWLAGAATYQAIDEKLVTEVDRSAISNAALIAPGISNEKATFPVGVSIVGIGYMTDVFKQRGFPPPSSWFDFWDPKFKGHVGGSSINISNTQALLVLTAKLLTGDERNIDPAIAKFKELSANALDFYTSPGAQETSIQQGDFWLGWTTNGGTQRMVRSGIKIGYAEPKEGYTGFPVQVGIVNKGPHPKAAAAWVDYLLSAEMQQKMVQTLGYTPVNLSAKIADDIKTYYPPLTKVSIPDWRYVASQLPSYVDKWNRIVER